MQILPWQLKTVDQGSQGQRGPKTKSPFHVHVSPIFLALRLVSEARRVYRKLKYFYLISIQCTFTAFQ